MSMKISRLRFMWDRISEVSHTDRESLVGGAFVIYCTIGFLVVFTVLGDSQFTVPALLAVAMGPPCLLLGVALSILFLCQVLIMVGECFRPFIWIWEQIRDYNDLESKELEDNSVDHMQPVPEDWKPAARKKKRVRRWA